MISVLNCLGIRRNNQVFNSSDIEKPVERTAQDVAKMVFDGSFAIEDLKEHHFLALGIPSRQISVLMWADPIKSAAALFFTLAALTLLVGFFLYAAGILILPLLIAALVGTGVSGAVIEGAHRAQAKAAMSLSQRITELGSS
ncbi:MAG: hypothetical protein A3E80_01505 [Chlamydiae bacterium RIFCSPHIGHO2_12_FULL_49_9]|nr:MAG: hypothetical protein A3E80_01505 [Chlamydiae bacterium RIFCSPHIGHO2_12_FULL_49_9]